MGYNLNMSKAYHLGGVHACIGGDDKYTSYVDAWINPDGSVLVARREQTAIGGMDGPGGSLPPGTTMSTLIQAKDVSGPALIKAIKASFDSTIRRYGSPTKSFSWCTNEKGLSGPKAISALIRAEDQLKLPK